MKKRIYEGDLKPFEEHLNKVENGDYELKPWYDGWFGTLIVAALILAAIAFSNLFS